MSRRYELLKPLLFRLEPEQAHRLALAALRAGLHPRAGRSDPRLRQRLLGLDFPNPIGVAAGLDKNGEVPDALLALGFGFVEIGTVTPKPQVGNPAPRLFRLVQHQAIVNRLGFNNEGHAAVARRLAERPRRGIVGVNLGANRDAADRVADYVEGVTRFAGLADYLTINVSSPNTPGLRGLQEKAALVTLLGAVVAARGDRPVPILVKIAPDLDEEALAAIAETVVASGIEGMIVANTTLSREGISGPYAGESGGLSGPPLFRHSTALLARLRKQVGRKLVLIGVGGVDSAETAFAKIAAGADLVQLYTGLIYRGPRLARSIVTGLPRLLEKRGLPSIEAAVGIDSERWAAETTALKRRPGRSA